jgi:radical SAM superfamily enzyme YgiQ (UPF0313 family)
VEPPVSGKLRVLGRQGRAADSEDVTARAREFLDRRFPGRLLERVLLVAPPDAPAEIFDPAIARRGTYGNFPPYGLAILAQNLRAAGIAVEIVNLNHEVLRICIDAAEPESFEYDTAWRHALEEALGRFKPHLVGITCMFTMSHDSLKSVCSYVAERGIPTVIGGVHVSNDVERVMDDIPTADMAVVREGDVALVRLANVIRGIDPVESLRQVLIGDDGRGRLHFLDEALPSEAEISTVPAYDLIEISDLSRYGAVGSFHYFKRRGAPIATCLSNRGCRAQCTFCSVRTFNGKGVRSRSVESVLDELQLLEEVHGVEHVMWLDDDLLKDSSRALALFTGKIKRGLKMTWDATNGVIAASCTEDLIAAAAESGCIAAIIGMESGNPKILRDIRKPGTVENFLRAAEIFRKHESIHASVFVMIGFPGETMGMIKDSLRVSQQMSLDWYRIKPLQPLPGTPIFESMVEQGLLDADAQFGTKVRYVTGAHGIGNQIKGALAPAHVEEIFDAIPEDSIPTPGQIDDLWFYMNYALNYKRVLEDRRPKKLVQHHAFTTAICDRISPEHPFALYASISLNRTLRGEFDEQRYARLERQLERSAFWSVRFNGLGLSLSDLEPPASGA